MQKVKGTSDYFPAEAKEQQQVFGAFRQSALCFAFDEVQPPAIEPMALLTKKSGEEIKSQIFTLDKRGSEELGLRFEFTASTARMFIERQKELAKPVKWFSIGRVWRYEQPQAGRMREFYQFNAEVFGSSKPQSDAEVINLAIDSLKSLGLKKGDFYVFVNNRKLLQGLLKGLVPQADIEKTLRAIDKRSKLTPAQFREELKFLKKRDDVIGLMNAGLDDLKGMELCPLAKEGYEEVSEVLALVDKAFAKFDLSTARGLAYYTGTVFEIFDAKRKYRALCGGGRYDNMIETFGGQPTPATGFGMGYATVSLLLRDMGLLKPGRAGADYFIASVAGADISRIVARLRRKYSVAFDLSCRNLGNQLKYANSIGAKKLIVIGPEELKSGKVNVKDMKSGKEKMSSLSVL